MKLNLCFLLFIITCNSIFSQNPVDFIPKNIDDYTLANKLIAEAYAPRFMHQVDGVVTEPFGYPGSCSETGIDPTGIRDFITAFDFDGDWNMLNNWENMYCIVNNNLTIGELQSLEELKPHVYYMVTWLETEWVITYTLFHPIDWNDCEYIPFYDYFDKHENDTEAGIVYVSREDFTVSHVKTIFHNETKSSSSPVFASTNRVIFEVDDETHSVVPFGIPANGTLPQTGCHSGFDYYMRYDFANGATPSIDLTDDIDNRSGLYKLVDIFEPGGLWSRRNDPQTIISGELVGDNGAGNNKAKAPWNWDFLPLRYPGPSNCNLPYLIEYDPFEGCGNSITEIGDLCPGNYNYDEPAERLALRIEEDMTLDGYEMNYGDILVEPNVRLNIFNSNLSFTGKLQLGEGSRLIISNSTLSGCGLPNSNEWEGIVFKESGLFTNETSTTSITIRNNSVISDAENGLGIRAPYNRPTIITLDISNTNFKNNFNGVKLWDQLSSEFEIKIRNSKFLENDRGISLWGCDLATVTKSEFSNCEYGIHMHDSYLKLTNDNKLTENKFGVYSWGNSPLAGGFLIGDQNTKFNTFERNKTNIVAQANNHPLGADIVNNYMDNTLSPVGVSGGNLVSIPLSTMIFGDCKSKFLNNTTIYTGIGSMNYANGENINRVGCNEYKQIYFTDVDVRFENSMTQVLQNNFVDTYASVGNIKLFSGDIDELQGSPENPAGNCFNEEDLKKLVSEDLVGVSTYFYKNEGLASCLYPGNEHELSLSPVQTEARHCQDQNVGIFTIAPPPPIDVELTPDFLPPLTYTPNEDDDCFPCIKNEITTLINQIINNSGDNPYTYLPEPDQNPLANNILNEQLDDAIHRGIYLAMNTQNVIFGEEILIPIKKWYYQIRLFGLYVYLEEHSKAETFLNALQPIEANEIAFVEVQRINLESLINVDFRLSPSQLTKLIKISESTFPVAGYARSLHYKLTGIDLPINFYDDRYKYNPRPRNNDIKEDNVSIYPNPANTELKIKSYRDIISISIINIHGKTVSREITDISEKEYVIDVSDFQEGIYFVRLEMANGTITNSRVIIK